MADIIKVKPNDTVTRILQINRNLSHSELPPWIKKVEKLNPHISNINRIYPGDIILIPASLHENVSMQDKKNLSSGILPASLKHHPHLYFEDIPAYRPAPGESIDTIAENMFKATPHSNQPLSMKRAVLLNNNPVLRNNPQTVSFGPHHLLNITPAFMKDPDIRSWDNTRLHLVREMNDLDWAAKQLYASEGRTSTYAVGGIVDHLKRLGTAVKQDDMITFAGYGATGASAYYNSKLVSLGQINALCQTIYDDAMKTLGKSVITSGKIRKLAVFETFLRNHPRYPELMGYCRDLPGQILPKGINLPKTAAGRNTPNAMFFKNNIVKVNLNYHISKKMAPLGKTLNGAVRIAKQGANRFTWFIPAILGGFAVSNAPQDKKMEALFEEGFGVVIAAIGSVAGVAIGSVATLCLCPIGAFTAIFIFSGLGGYWGNEGGKIMGKNIYDNLNEITQGKIINSFDHIWETHDVF